MLFENTHHNAHNPQQRGPPPRPDIQIDKDNSLREAGPATRQIRGRPGRVFRVRAKSHPNLEDAGASAKAAAFERWRRYPSERLPFLDREMEAASSSPLATSAALRYEKGELITSSVSCGSTIPSIYIRKSQNLVRINEGTVPPFLSATRRTHTVSNDSQLFAKTTEGFISEGAVLEGINPDPEAGDAVLRKRTEGRPASEVRIQDRRTEWVLAELSRAQIKRIRRKDPQETSGRLWRTNGLIITWHAALESYDKVERALQMARRSKAFNSCPLLARTLARTVD
ncbi:hypothetical protein B0H11DRAFT_2201087 [Mycena galericulata]|nr:hypothetical protein B0H11DRAFT_2201087 [Mycena galericulata]